MIRILIIVFFTLSFKTYAQNELEMRFLKDKIIGDTLYLSEFSKKPMELDTNEFFAYIILSKKSGIIDSNFVTHSVTDKLEYNNNFKWNQLDPSQFEIYGKHSHDKDLKPTNFFSLPIQLDSNTVMIKHGWFYDSLYAGAQIDVWRLNDGDWEKIRSYLIWMS